MNNDDKALGMGARITRRDLFQGAAMVGAGITLASKASAQTAATGAAGSAPVGADAYPPLRTGIRGQHPGSYESAHAMRDGEQFGTAETTGEAYDLVVVGAGISGLAAAYFYRQRFGMDAKILLLDNHDDFGGHARRNEFEHDGKILMANAGSSYLVGPSYWTQDSRNLLLELGVMEADTNARANTALRDRDMVAATFFSRDHYGADLLVKGGNPLSGDAAWLKQTPFSEKIQADLARVMTEEVDYLPELGTEAKIAKLRATSYRDYLIDVVKLDPESARIVGGVWCLGQDMCSAWFAFFRGKPGFAGLGLTRPFGGPEQTEITSDDYSMLAGNSDMARLMLRDLIPAVLPQGSVADIQMARVDYSKLDEVSSNVRLRLGSMVVRVTPIAANGPLFSPDTSESDILYIKEGKLLSVHAKDVVLACMNNVIPHILPELPPEQKDALHQAVRAPNLMTNVLFRNWEAFAELGVNHMHCPRGFYSRFAPSAQRYFGGYVPSEAPDQPIIVSFNVGSNSGIANSRDMVEGLLGEAAPAYGTDMDAQFRMIRSALLQTPFETFERHVRRQATDALAGTSFDPERDILGITVNRWGHGFATGRNTYFEPEADQTPSPTLAARMPFGRITIANSDAGGVSTAATAIDQAFRAVRELERQSFGFYETI